MVVPEDCPELCWQSVSKFSFYVTRELSESKQTHPVTWWSPVCHGIATRGLLGRAYWCKNNSSI
jgi:hypothetical protein